LLETMVDVGVGRLVFSSSAAVYGVPITPTVSEHAPLNPINPYGRTKLIGEHLLGDAAAAYGISFVALRYFNAVGADEMRLADHDSPNLFASIVRAIESGNPVQVMGGDYATPDGTGVRDYVHIADLADAHVRAIDYLASDLGQAVYNVGTGCGYSVLEVLDQVRRETGRAVSHRIVTARVGDPACVIAATAKIARELNWTAQHDLASMVASACRTIRTLGDGGLRQNARAASSPAVIAGSDLSLARR
jgi:UDP-glucose 4-epimerase